MITFELRNLIPEGPANVEMSTGKTTQNCSIIVVMLGLAKGEVLLTDTVIFEVDSAQSIAEAWKNILTVQAPAWVAEKYAEEKN